MKSEIRENVIFELKKLSQDSVMKEKQETAILRQLFSSDLWKKSQIIGVTMSMPFEFDTKKVITKALDDGKTIAIPKTFPNKQMCFFYHDLAEILEESSFGVLEPTNEKLIEKEAIDLLIVPGVAFNKDGYRIGFGGGFYDRYLMDFTGETCSLVFNEQLKSTLTIEEHDLPVSYLFTSSIKEELDDNLFA